MFGDFEMVVYKLHSTAFGTVLSREYTAFARLYRCEHANSFIIEIPYILYILHFSFRFNFFFGLFPSERKLCFTITQSSLRYSFIFHVVHFSLFCEPHYI